MKRLRKGFVTSNKEEVYYDIYDDWNLIEASFAKQYGIRIREVANQMSWNEFCNLISGLMQDTPLGQVIAIRAEKDPKVIKNFNSYQRKIYNEWKNRQVKKQLQNKENLEQRMKQLEIEIARLFG